APAPFRDLRAPSRSMLPALASKRELGPRHTLPSAPRPLPAAPTTERRLRPHPPRSRPPHRQACHALRGYAPRA
ncbi:hypothetical protein P7K49_032331, partial [Saguinus oedipus]